MNIPELKDIEFEKFRLLVYENCGINLHEGKKELVNARLQKRLQAGKFPSFSHYYRHVISEEGTNELIKMIDSISTNLTYFFREKSHFLKLTALLPSIMEASAGRETSKLSIWSAACSTGEEPYSLAMTIMESNVKLPMGVKILGTDISTGVLQAAERGIYSEDKIKDIAPDILKRYFQRGEGKWSEHYRVKKEIRNMVQFKRFNLMNPPPSRVFFDVIFCRNVMIYFDKPTQEGLVKRLSDSLVKGGYFFIGHSESLTSLKHDFKYIEPSVYRK
ncbi:MAG: protein-glutamate O-methyltransferase [Syntrophales bacterium LBB04]|nr:protein-glutamate O-methyltransferase [Syntrophales bacterium LBB04]